MAQFEHHSPVVIVEDRYSGTYSGGQWLAVSQADRTLDVPLPPLVTRLKFLLTEGPYGSPELASAFWRRHPKWVARGDSLWAAIDHVRSQNEHERYGHYPIAVLENPMFSESGDDPWIAVSRCNLPVDAPLQFQALGVLRIEYVLADGPHSNDVDAAGFWTAPPSWIAVGDLPDQALTNLLTGIRPIPVQERLGKDE